MKLKIADTEFDSRLLVGTARYPNMQVMLKALQAAHAELVTVGIRRINLEEQSTEGLISQLKANSLKLLPNTAGCYTVKEAILVAQMAREALSTNWIKLEIIADDETLYPDSEKIVEAARELVAQDFVVLAYCSDDPIICTRLEASGVHAVMPLGSPIGSGMGLLNQYNLKLIRHRISAPLIVDAGIGTASDVTTALELGYDGVLVNTAIAEADDPVLMAEAMYQATLAGRNAYCAGRIPRRYYAQASTSILNKPFSN